MHGRIERSSLSAAERAQKHWRAYRHFAGLARQASHMALAEMDRRAPGWEARWTYWMDVQAQAAGTARNDRRRYAALTQVQL